MGGERFSRNKGEREYGRKELQKGRDDSREVREEQEERDYNYSEEQEGIWKEGDQG